MDSYSHLEVVMGVYSHSTLSISLMMRYLIHGWEEWNSNGMNLRGELK